MFLNGTSCFLQDLFLSGAEKWHLMFMNTLLWSTHPAVVGGPVPWGQRKAAEFISSVHLFTGLVSEGLLLWRSPELGLWESHSLEIFGRVGGRASLQHLAFWHLDCCWRWGNGLEAASRLWKKAAFGTFFSEPVLKVFSARLFRDVSNRR